MEGRNQKRLSTGYLDGNLGTDRSNASYSKLDINGLESNRKQPSQKRRSDMPSSAEFHSKDLLN